jgi:polysaccharide pyruvyl transferase WcaK-like protein
MDLVNIRFSKKVLSPNHVAALIALFLAARLCPPWVRERLASANPWFRALGEADLFCAMSGGDSFGDLYGFKRLVYVALPQVLALVTGKPLVLLPQSLGPFDSLTARTLARWILVRAALVFSRETDGLDTLQALLGKRHDPRRLQTCPDVGFVVDPLAPVTLTVTGLRNPFSGQRPLVGLNVSGLLARGGYTGRNMFGLRDDYGQLIERLIERLIEQSKASVLLVPHTFGPPGSAADAPVCRRLYEAFAARYPGRVGYLNNEHAHDEIRYVVGRCDFFVGSRMHACIAALSQGVPVAAIAYSDKFSQALNVLDGGVTVLDARVLNAGEILEGVFRALAAREEGRRVLERRIPWIRRQVFDRFDRVPSVVSRQPGS